MHYRNRHQASTSTLSTRLTRLHSNRLRPTKRRRVRQFQHRYTSRHRRIFNTTRTQHVRRINTNLNRNLRTSSNIVRVEVTIRGVLNTHHRNRQRQRATHHNSHDFSPHRYIIRAVSQHFHSTNNIFSQTTGHTHLHHTRGTLHTFHQVVYGTIFRVSHSQRVTNHSGHTSINRNIIRNRHTVQTYIKRDMANTNHNRHLRTRTNRRFHQTNIPQIKGSGNLYTFVRYFRHLNSGNLHVR